MADFKVEGIIEIDSSRAVRDIQKFNRELKKTFTETRAVVKAIKDLDGMRARVNLDAEKAKADAAQLKAQIEELNRERAEIRLTVEAAEAELKLRKIQNQVNDLDRQKADVDIGFHGPMTEMAELEAEIKAIDGTDIWIDAHLDAHKALEDAAKLNAELDALIDEHKVVKVDVDRSGFDSLRDAISGATFSLGSPGGGGLIGGIALLATTLGPLTAVASGVAAGMVGSFATMGAGVGAFTGFAIPTIKDVISGFKLLDTETDKLSPEKLKAFQKQMAEFKKGNEGVYQAAQALKTLKDRYMELANEIRPIVIDAFKNSLDAAKVAMEGFFPAAKGAGRAIRDLMDDAKKGLKGEEWQTFFKYIGDNARNFTEVWGHTIGNFITGIANMISAFDPLTKFVNDGFLGMSESFRNWTKNLADSPGFKKFVEYVKTEGPKIWDGLGQITLAIINIFKALAPLGGAILDKIFSLAESFNKLSESNPKLATLAATLSVLALAAIPLVSPLASLVTPLISIFGALGTAGAVVGGVLAVVGALAGIGTVLALVTDTGKPFQEMWGALRGLWEGLQESAAKVRDRLSELWDYLKQHGMIENFQSGIRDLAIAFNELRPALEIVATIIGGALMVGIFTIGTAFKTLGIIVRSTVEGFKRIWGALKDLPAKFQQAKDAIVSKWNSMKQKVVEIAVAVGAAVKQKFDQIKNSIRDKISSAVQTVKDKFNNMKQTALTVISAMVSAVRDKFSQIINSIRDKISQAPGVVRSKISAAKEALASAMARMVTAAAKAMQNIIQAIRTKLGQAKAAVTGAFSGAIGWLKTAGQNIMRGLVQGIGDGIQWVKDKLGSVTKLIPDWKGPAETDKKLLRPVGQMIMQGLVKGFDDGVPGVQAVLGKITDLIQRTMEKRFKDSDVAKKQAEQVIKSLKDEADAMLQNAKAREHVMAKIDKQKEKLQGLIDTQKQYAASVRDSVLEFGSIGNVGQRTDEEGNQIGPTAGTIVEDMKAKLQEAKTYKDYMNQLIEMDLNKETLDQLTSMGVEAGLATAKAIIDGGQATVDEINTLTAKLKKTGQSMGNQVSKEMYQAGIQSVRGVISGLREKKADLIAVAKELGRAMTRAFQSELKIKSPSRVFIDFGHMTGEGLVKGIKDQIPRVESATKGLTDSMMNMGSVNPLGWADNFSAINDTHASTKGSGSESSETPPVEVKVYIGDSELKDIVRVEVGDTISPLRTKTRQGGI